jgi:hypothetical protein
MRWTSGAEEENKLCSSSAVGRVMVTCAVMLQWKGAQSRPKCELWRHRSRHCSHFWHQLQVPKRSKTALNIKGLLEGLTVVKIVVILTIMVYSPSWVFVGASLWRYKWLLPKWLNSCLKSADTLGPKSSTYNCMVGLSGVASAQLNYWVWPFSLWDPLWPFSP